MAQFLKCYLKADESKCALCPWLAEDQFSMCEQKTSNPLLITLDTLFMKKGTLSVCVKTETYIISVDTDDSLILGVPPKIYTQKAHFETSNVKFCKSFCK